MPVNQNPFMIPEVDTNTQFDANIPIPEPSEPYSIPVSSPTPSTIDFNDTNQILVTIEDKTTPIVILFGPPSCGKTMTMVRMTRWFNRNGYTIDPVRSFRPAEDTNYQNMCESFNALVSSDNRANSTNAIQFMLLKVYNQGYPICQILEAPGELYFDPSNPTAQYPAFFQTLMSGPNRKIWCIFVEPDWKNMSNRIDYVTRIKKMKERLGDSDRVIILSNKVDKTSFVLSKGRVNEKGLFKAVSDSYPGIFDLFKNEIPICRLFKPYNCDHVPYQTGYYSPTNTGIETFQEGPSEYCELLWNSIMKNIRR